MPRHDDEEEEDETEDAPRRKRRRPTRIERATLARDLSDAFDDVHDRLDELHARLDDSDDDDEDDGDIPKWAKSLMATPFGQELMSMFLSKERASKILSGIEKKLASLIEREGE